LSTPVPGTATAVAREAAWLAAYNPADGLPGLLRAHGGPFDVVQPYWPRTPAARKNCLYVLRRNIQSGRTANIRTMDRYQFLLRIVWPLSSRTGSAETVQQALDDAVGLVLQRVGGLFMDKTHGGRFLSVAENPPQSDADFHDPESSIPGQNPELRVDIVYWADDFETSG
jgi:hypothetical protein